MKLKLIEKLIYVKWSPSTCAVKVYLFYNKINVIKLKFLSVSITFTINIFIELNNINKMDLVLNY